MTSQDYMESVMEGARLAGNPCYATLAQNLCHELYKERQHIRWLEERIDRMDQVSSDAPVFTVRCRACEKAYDLPCELSQFDPDMSYCGGSPRCCP